jgi:hypothetical protein
MARAALRWAIRDLAREARVAPATITRLEANLSAHRSRMAIIRETLERVGVVFTRHRHGEGVRLTYAAECVQDLIFLARSSRTSVGEGRIDTAIRGRIDSFLAASGRCRKRQRTRGRNIHVRELQERLKAESRNAEPSVVGALKQALKYVELLNRSSS